MAPDSEETSRSGLNWPEHDLVPASRRDLRPADGGNEPAPEPPEPEEPPSASVLFTVASRLEGLKSSLAAVGSRVEALARSEEQFREFTTARLGEHAEQIATAVRDISTDMQERARAQDKSLSDLQSGLDTGAKGSQESIEALDQLRQRSEEMGQSLEVLAGHVQAVAEDLPTLRAEIIDFVARSDSRDEELAAEVTRLVEEVKVLRRRLPLRAAASTAPPARRARRAVEPEDEDDDDFIREEPAEAPARQRPIKARRSK